jgi:hypothetical protein
VYAPAERRMARTLSERVFAQLTGFRYGFTSACRPER